MRTWKVQIELSVEYEDILAENEDDAIEKALERANNDGTWCITVSQVEEEIL